ncbi:MAG: MFS transporter [Actinomycetota bacterium]|nr:MFS transporter [Actinomycetota bacterium]
MNDLTGKGNSRKAESAGRAELAGDVKSDLKILWTNFDFRRLWVGQSISAVGDWVATFALLALVWNRSGSAAAVAGLLVLRIIPSAFSGALATWISDRWDRKKIMIYCDIIRGIMILWVAILDSLVYLYIIIFFMEFFSVVYMAARDASLPNLVEGDNKLTMANSMTMGSSYGSIPLAAAFFALLVVGQSPFLRGLEQVSFFATHPYSFSFIIDALTFFASAFMISRIRKPLILYIPSKREAEGGEGKKESFLSSIAFAFRNRFMRTLTVALATGTLGGGALFAVGVVYVHEVLKGNDTEFGFLMALFGLGMLAGLIGLQFISRVRAKWFIFKVGLLVAGGTLIWMSLITVMFMGYIAALVFGAAFSLIFLTGITLVQEMIEDENRGKAFAVFHSISRIFLLIGAAVAAALAGTVSDFHINLGFYNLHVWGVTIVMFASGILIASVTFLPIRERIEEQEKGVYSHRDGRDLPVEEKRG